MLELYSNEKKNKIIRCLQENLLFSQKKENAVMLNQETYLTNELFVR